MMKQLSLGIGALSLGLFWPLATPEASADTVSQLAKNCETVGEAVFPTGLCYGYITATTDILLERNAMSGKPQFCLPSTASKAVVIASVIDFLIENPSSADMPAHIAIEYALRVRFRCG